VSVEAHVERQARSLALEAGAWHSLGKPLPTADELRIRELVKSLLKTRALAFVAEAGGSAREQGAERLRPEYGFGAPRGSVVLGKRAVEARGSAREPNNEAGKAAGALRLELGADSARGVYARFDGGDVFEVGRAVLDLVRELAGGPRMPEPVPAKSEDEEGDELDLHHHDHE
jgi:hypothetical protein